MLSTILKIVSELIDFESLVDQRSAHSNVRPCSATLPVVSRVRADPAGLACKAEEAGEGQGLFPHEYLARQLSDGAF